MTANVAPRRTAIKNGWVPQKDGGAPDPADTDAEWEHAFSNPGVRAQWRAVTTIERAGLWTGFGYSPEDVTILGWQHSNPHGTVGPWATNGFDRTQVLHWFRCGLTTETQAREAQERAPDSSLDEHGHVRFEYFTVDGNLEPVYRHFRLHDTLPPAADHPPTAESVAAAFAPHSDQAWEWAFPHAQTRNMWLDTTARSRAAGTLDALQAKRWADNYSWNDTVQWIDSAISNARAAVWAPTEVPPYIVIGLGWADTNPDDTWMPWHHAGFTPKAVASWAEVGVTDIVVAERISEEFPSDVTAEAREDLRPVFQKTLDLTDYRNDGWSRLMIADYIRVFGTLPIGAPSQSIMTDAVSIEDVADGSHGPTGTHRP